MDNIKKLLVCSRFPTLGDSFPLGAMHKVCITKNRLLCSKVRFINLTNLNNPFCYMEC